MSDGPTLSVGGGESSTDDGPVPTPRAPDDPDAWYALSIQHTRRHNSSTEGFNRVGPIDWGWWD
ncbi:hypothetical protein [Haloplanus natans]|uniref:hypothetical protein n=1 Tax=Haloplanus natans TaxID=376171 RepID=UPI0012FA20DD|nr:hypothetical protein [Haloplanus natans]